MATNNWNKFKLLMWKNWTIQWNHKIQLLFELMVPPMFSIILVYLRAVILPVEITVNTTCVKYSIKGIDDLLYHQLSFGTPVQLAIVYSPENQYLQQIMKGVADKILDLKFYKIAIIPKENNYEVEKFMINQPNMPIAGVVFDQKLKNTETVPKVLSYSLRFPSELRLASYGRRFHWNTNNLFHYYVRKPRCKSFPDYNVEGFLAIQNAIAEEYFKLLGILFFPIIWLQSTPYPPYISDQMLFILQNFSSMLLILSFIYPVSQTVKHITLEKESKIKEVMKIMGLPNWLHWTAWFIKTYNILAFSMCILVFLLTIKLEKHVAIFNYSDWSVILLFFLIYAIAITTFCFMLAAFFSKSNNAAAVSGLIWFTMYMPFILTFVKYPSYTLPEKLFMCCSLNIGFSYAVRIILIYESYGIGVQWENVFNGIDIQDDLNMGFIMIMMLIVSVLQMIITLYVEKILPGEFGSSEKWYFPLTLSFWKNCFRNNHVNRNMRKSGSRIPWKAPIHDNATFFEPEPMNKLAGIQIQNLVKKFGRKLAVNKLSINMYIGEITVLLGHNGAGKTTTVSMVTGLFPPSSGSILINGYDVKTELVQARASLGFCPQHDVLFDDLTVREHIIFFSCLKGMKKHEIEKEVQKFVRILEIEEKKNTLSKNLSGGMKRKLSVCTALCGNSKIIILDEPSSGMDPAARRSLWNLIQAEKNDRTFLITTHYMDEADVLGDRIAILAGGELKCYGTSFFLKKKLGAGYHLVCEKAKKCDSVKVTAVLNSFIPTIRIESETSSELTYRLPDSYSPIFEKMFAKLEELEDLNGYGISTTTLEEIFLKIGSEEARSNDGGSGSSISIISYFNHNNQANILRNSDLHTGFRLICYQWHAMLMKKALFSKKNIILLCIQIIIPPLLIIMSIILAKAAFSLAPLQKLPIDLTMYRTSVTLVQGSESDIIESFAIGYKSYIESFGKTHIYKFIDSDFSSYFLNLALKTKGIYNKMYLAVSTIYPDSINIWHNTEAYHSLPLSLNIAHNGILRAIQGNEYGIKVSNEPLPFRNFKGLASDPVKTVIFQMVIFSSFCFSFVSSFYIIAVIKERSTRSKLIQLISGIKIFIYWAGHFVYDYILFIAIILITLVTLFSFQEDGLSRFDEFYRLLMLYVLFALAVIPFSYILSRFFNDSGAGFLFLSIFNIFTGLSLFILVTALKPIHGSLAKSLHYTYLIFPHYCLASGVFQLSMIAYIRLQCIKLCDDIGSSTPDGNSICDINTICKSISYCCTEDYFSWEEPGITMNLISFSISSVVYSIILIILEYQCCVCIRTGNHSSKRQTRVQPVLDDDVIFEQQRINHITRYNIISENLVIHKVTKQFKGFLAVNRISVAVKRGECFGLLGVNGAGKTTLFKMMTGDENISFGNVYIQGISIKDNKNLFYQKIGYCPQFDALLEQLTGKETLKIFSLIHGIPKNRINEIIDNMAKSFGFGKHLNKKIKRCSGGTKRKISTCLALLGAPLVIFLDEPTTGMDPVSRRQFWNILCEIRDSGKSIVLTSHSMEECEALCTRLAIMVNGEFQCIGSTQHLKNKFSKGIILKIKVKTNKDDFDNSFTLNLKVELIKSFIEKQFPESYLRERYQSLLTFYIPLTVKVQWSKMFGIMENKKDDLKIEDYSLSQTTLEEIFLAFAIQQRENRRI